MQGNSKPPVVEPSGIDSQPTTAPNFGMTDDWEEHPDDVANTASNIADRLTQERFI